MITSRSFDSDFFSWILILMYKNWLQNKSTKQASLQISEMFWTMGPFRGQSDPMPIVHQPQMSAVNMCCVESKTKLNLSQNTIFRENGSVIACSVWYHSGQAIAAICCRHRQSCCFMSRHFISYQCSTFNCSFPPVSQL